MAGRAPGSIPCFPYWHFHTRGHEVLACVSGRARIGFGGDRGIKVDVETGDVCVIPAGVGHRRLDASGDFQMAGGYPPGQQGNIVRPGELDDATIAREIAALALPETDPISGLADGVVAIWRGGQDRSGLQLTDRAALHPAAADLLPVEGRGEVRCPQ